MKPSDFQKTVQCRFESCLKKVVRHVVKDYQQGLKRRKEKEVSFCELPEIVVEKLAVWDEYESDYTAFEVCGIEVRILDDELSVALKNLSERSRENLLMYYFLEMSDKEIADLLHIDRSTSDGTYTLAMPGKMFSSMPGRNTTGNSRPFAECTVMSTTESALLS